LPGSLVPVAASYSRVLTLTVELKFDGYVR